MRFFSFSPVRLSSPCWLSTPLLCFSARQASCCCELTPQFSWIPDSPATVWCFFHGYYCCPEYGIVSRTWQWCFGNLKRTMAGVNIVECSIKYLRLNQWLGSLLSSRTVLSLSSRQPQSSKSGFPIESSWGTEADSWYACSADIDARSLSLFCMYVGSCVS